MSDAPEPTTRTAPASDDTSEATSGAEALLRTVRTWWPGWRDVACLVFLVTATFHLVMNDGGRPFRPMLPVLVFGVLAVVAAFPTFAGTSRWLRLLALAWVLGPLIAFAFADVRAGWVRPVAAWAIAVPAALATLHLLRRRWGPAAVATIVGGALALAWFNGFMIWWGGGTARGEPAWMALSWHNQSGALMGVLGVGGLGVALATIGWPRVLGVAAAAAGLSATWLSGSRGAVLTAAGAVLVTVLIAVRRPPRDDDAATSDAPAETPDAQAETPDAQGETPDAQGEATAIEAAVPADETPAPLSAARREIEVPAIPQPATTGIVTLTVASLTIALTLGLAATWSGSTPGEDGGGISAQPVTARNQDAAGNLRARFGHWEAAVRMFAASPLTGTGPGSYMWSSRPVYPEDTNLTASAHGEQVEALGELGIVGGGAALILTLGLAWLVLGTIRRPGRHHLEVAAAGAATFLAAHAALDFDWDYPVLLALLAIAATALLVARRHERDPDSEPGPAPRSPADAAVTVLASVAAVALLAAGMIGITLNVRGTSPWALDPRIGALVVAAEEGDRVEATRHLDAIETWNPGAPRLPEVRALASHALGDITDEQLVEVIDADRSGFADQLRAAERLLAADRPDLALSIVQEARPVIDRRRAWGITARVADATSLELTARYQLGGCDEVDPALPDLRAWLLDHDLDPAAVVDLPSETDDEAAADNDGQAGWTGCDLTTLLDG